MVCAVGYNGSTSAGRPDFDLKPNYHAARERIKKYYPLDMGLAVLAKCICDSRCLLRS